VAGEPVMESRQEEQTVESANEAREELVRNRGTQFDPNVVDAILAVAA
jgi:HD-GYP domain-containing protein (c-di-GMP phosphodiesterase class II)